MCFRFEGLNTLLNSQILIVGTNAKRNGQLKSFRTEFFLPPGLENWFIRQKSLKCELKMTYLLNYRHMDIRKSAILIALGILVVPIQLWSY